MKKYIIFVTMLCISILPIDFYGAKENSSSRLEEEKLYRSLYANLLSTNKQLGQNAIKLQAFLKSSKNQKLKSEMRILYLEFYQMIVLTKIVADFQEMLFQEAKLYKYFYTNAVPKNIQKEFRILIVGTNYKKNWYSKVLLKHKSMLSMTLLVYKKDKNYNNPKLKPVLDKYIEILYKNPLWKNLSKSIKLTSDREKKVKRN